MDVSCTFSKFNKTSDICADKKIDTFGCGKRDEFVVIVEGNIGCGKSTFLNHFDGSSEYLEVLQEPVREWCDLRGHNVLDLMYKDSKRWSAAFQAYVQLTMFRNHGSYQKRPVKMLERSLHSARLCFVENMYQTGAMDDMDYNILDEWYQWASARSESRVDLIVYLQARPEVCLERVKKRARSEEVSIPLKYLEQLHELHEKWLVKKEYGEPVAPVLCIDTEQDLDKLSRVYESYRADVLCGFE